jgi:hypothetical protein
MANGQAKKLNVALHLDPATSQADAAALDALQAWFTQAKQSAGGEAEMEAAISTLHHDVYLAGLHLYLIDSRLCRQFAGALAQGNHSVGTLQQQLQACGLMASPEATKESAHEATFSEAQLQQLAQIVANAPAATPEADGDEARISHQLTDQSAQLNVMSAELKTLRALAEQQYAELQRLKAGGPVTSAPAAPKSPGTEEMDVTGMEPEIAQMRKIRDKGVF